MSRRNKADKLAESIQWALRPGEFISYAQAWDLVSDLEELKGRIDGMAAGWAGSRNVSP